MKLGERLVKNELVDPQQIKKAMYIQQKTGGRLGEILLAISHMRSLDYYRALAEHYKMTFVDLLENEPNQTLLIDEDHDRYLSTLTIPIQYKNNILTVATANPTNETIQLIKKHWGDETQIVCTAKFDILSTLQDRFKDNYLDESVNKLINHNVAFSAKKSFSTWQLIFIAFILCVCLYLIIFRPTWFFLAFNVLLTLSVSVILIYKIALSIITLFINSNEKKFDMQELPEKELPIYTILVPLFKEKEITLEHLIKNLKAIYYPKDKLDIKLLLEQDDEETISILKTMNLPAYFEFVYIPAGEPRTKAKACNYGLQFARGEYLTLYDAEDQPDAYQLKKALFTFYNGNENNLACVQSKLNYYNASENWLTCMFTIEYTYWFDLLLPSLKSIGTPIPLGGTSNHFKTAILKDIEAWDPYNVAEDADIGIRLQRLGYTSNVIDSTTYEEANCRLMNWIKQRTRWVKGYMQTYLVHMRNPYQLWRALGTRGYIGFQLFIGGTIISNICYILLWVLFGLMFIMTPEQQNYYFPFHTKYLAYVNFVLGSLGIILLNFLGIMKRRLYKLAFYSLTAPFYWFLISIASYRALYQLIFKPSYWDKTEHGISKMLKST